MSEQPQTGRAVAVAELIRIHGPQRAAELVAQADAIQEARPPMNEPRQGQTWQHRNEGFRVRVEGVSANFVRLSLKGEPYGRLRIANLVASFKRVPSTDEALDLYYRDLRDSHFPV